MSLWKPQSSGEMTQQLLSPIVLTRQIWNAVLPLRGCMYSRQQGSFILRKFRIHSFGECWVSDSCGFTMCFTPWKVSLYQDAINLGKKNNLTLQDPLQLHTGTPGWGGHLLRRAVRWVHQPHTQLLYTLTYKLHTHFSKQVSNEYTILLKDIINHPTTFSLFHKAKQPTDGKRGTFLQPGFKQTELSSFNCA